MWIVMSKCGCHTVGTGDAGDRRIAAHVRIIIVAGAIFVIGDSCPGRIGTSVCIAGHHLGFIVFAVT